MQNRGSKVLYLVAIATTVCGLGGAAAAQSQPSVPSQYRRYFVHYVDNRSILEKSLNLIGMTGNDVGRSFALVAGVSRYPRLAPGSRNLSAAKVDRDQLVSYLENEEFFDEVVVLWDEDANLSNLAFFLKEYFPSRLSKFPKSRFLFAYSGHGFSRSDDAFLLGSNATGLGDTTSAISLRALRALVDETVRSGYQVLVLLNSCYAGALLTGQTFGPYIPNHPGAHAITAGAAQEKAWSDSRFGAGSVFFEKVLAGLGGAADTQPKGGDGIITASELFAYLRREVQISTDQRQSPQFGDLSAKQSEGEFFFLNRSRQFRAGLVPAWNPMLVANFGGDAHPGRADESADIDNRKMTAVSGTVTLDRKAFEMTLSGSFGNEKISGIGSILSVELLVSPSTARYERIEYRTTFAAKKLSGAFLPGFGKKPIPIELDLSLAVAVSTSRASDEYPLLPSSDGTYQLGPFTTSDCGFSCYRMDVAGTWSAKTPEHDFKGEIRGSLAESGIGADAVGTLDPAGYPESVKLKGFHWHGNTGGRVADILDTTVDGIHLQLRAVYVDFFGTDGSDLTLRSSSYPN